MEKSTRSKSRRKEVKIWASSIERMEAKYLSLRSERVGGARN